VNRLKLAELSSGVGALVAGVGLGALSARWLEASAGLVLASGVVLHAWGMWDKHRLEAGGPEARWSAVLYWVCWVLLAVAAIFVLARAVV
jgi:uncharacterized membrane protein YecN with MAPEG domain